MASERLSPLPEASRDADPAVAPTGPTGERGGGYELLPRPSARRPGRRRGAGPAAATVLPTAARTALHPGFDAEVVMNPTATEPPSSGTQQLREAVRQLILRGGPTMVFQPQLSLSRLEIGGYEALARFPEESIPAPEHWFSLAHDVGLGAALEACAIARALDSGDRPEGTLLAVNLSPSVLGSAPLRAVLPRDLSGIEIELTEHEAVGDHLPLRRELDRLRERGARLAIDDVGSGHSSLHRVVDLAPESLKLDRSLVEGVAADPAKIALIRAIVTFADEIGATVCAEGVERLDDLLTLADLDVEYAQGWIVGLPDLAFGRADPAIVAAGRRSRRHLLAAPAPASPGSVDDLGGLLAEVGDIGALLALVASAAFALNCDDVRLSQLLTDVRGVADLGDTTRSTLRLLDRHAAVRTCVDNRLVVPLDATTGGPLGVGETPGVLLAPVVSRGRAVGVIECRQSGEAPFSRRQIRAARVFGCMLGPVLEGLVSPNHHRE